MRYLFYLLKYEYSNNTEGLKIGDVITITAEIASGLISVLFVC
jgi:hypothetical protein